MLSRLRFWANHDVEPWSPRPRQESSIRVRKRERIEGHLTVALDVQGHSTSVVVDPNDGCAKALGSNIEHNVFMTLCADPEVGSIACQAPPMEWVDADGEVHVHYFDFRVVMKSGRRKAVMVKEADKERRGGLEDFAALLAEQMPPGFADEVVLLTDEDLPAWLVANARLIHSARLDEAPGFNADTATCLAALSQTFHAFGLAVIGAATGQKPRLAPWVDKGEEGQVMTDIAKHLIATDRRFARDWDMLRTVYAREMRSGGKGSDPDGYKNGRRGLATASGDVVKSDEERRIADWLFFMGVQFEYERQYEHETADEQHSSYHPDFYYPEHRLYHEHFAIDRDGKSSFGEKYLQGAAWKRELHERHGTELFETASHQMRASRGSDGRHGEVALLRLEDELVKRGQILKFDANRELKGFFQPTSGQAVVKLIQTFQKHVKNNGLTMADLHAKIDSTPGDKSRLDLFVSIYERIAAVWDQKLRDGNYLDFEDMLTQAAEHIESGRYASPFKVVLADEFQDSSRARVRMLKALTARQGQRAHLCVVGDDWQGINRFAGSDIAVMTEFERQFDGATRLVLGTTFRCPPTICDVSSRFVQRNPAQIRKQVKTTNALSGAQIRIFGFENMDATSGHIESELAIIHGAAGNRERKAKVLFLGRYRDDEPYLLQPWQRRFGDRVELSYRTVHASKGLEAEHVFLLNAIGGNRGFPSQIEDDPVLQIAMPAPDDYPFAEERPLFYVALTRASRDIRIYTSLSRPSAFVNELQTQEKIAIEAIDGEASIPCPKCSGGVLKTRKGRSGPFLGCSTFPKCSHTQPLAAGRERVSFGAPPQK